MASNPFNHQVEPSAPQPGDGSPAGPSLPRSGGALPPRPPSQNPSLPGGEPEFHFGEYLEKFRRRWKLIAAAVILCGIAASIHYAMTPKLYQARSRIQIERRSLSPLNSAQALWLENWWNTEFYPTQYELLKSRGLAERVVLRLRLAEDPSFNPGGRALSASGIEDPESADAVALASLAARLRGGLQVQPVRTTQLVDLTYISQDPAFAARAANGFAEAFIDWGIENRTDTAGRASNFLSSQIDSLKEEIQTKEGQLQDLSRNSDTVSLDQSETNVSLQRLETFNRDYMEAKGERIDKEASYQELLDTPRQEVADRYSDGMVSDLIRAQNQRELTYQNQLQTYKEDHPVMRELQAEIDEGREQIDRVVRENFQSALQNAQAEYQTALRKEQALARELEGQKGALLDQSSAAVEYSNLAVEVATRRELLNEVLRRQSETEVTARLQGTRESNVRIVDRAMEPGGPFRPSLRNDLSAGLFLGLMLGVGGAFLLDYMDRTLKTPEEVERRMGLPNLALVPDVSASARGYYGYGGGEGSGLKARLSSVPGLAGRSGEGRKGIERIELIPHHRPRLAISEAYRALRTALLLSSANDLRVVAITSAGAGEGKSATSVNLAIVMAQLNRRVLLIDADLRRPRLHEIFGVSNRQGLVNVLAGGEDPGQVMAPLEVPNLSLIPSGPIPPNPSELLSSDRMRELLERARGRFDFVIVDTPPVLAVTDSTLVGSMVDGVVLCLRAGKVTREDAMACRDRLLMAEVKILGTVLNRHRESSAGRRSSYYYYQSYGAENEVDRQDPAA